MPPRKIFHNVDPIEGRSLLQALRWMLTRRRPKWPKWIASIPYDPPPRLVDSARLRVTFVNHATVLIQTADMNILTDPIWSDRCSPFSGIGPRRVRAPGIRFQDLPRIDLVLISHNHYDHLDLPTLKQLNEQHEPQFVVGTGNAKLLEEAGIACVMEMEWWETQFIGTLRLTCVPAQHWSGRGLADRSRALWCGYYLRTPQQSVYFAGDTGWGSHFKLIAGRLGAPRIAILPIGAHKPRWFMAPVHMSPAEAVKAHQLLGATASLGIHYGTFQLADDAQEDALDELKQALKENNLTQDEFWTLNFGEGREIGP